MSEHGRTTGDGAAKTPLRNDSANAFPHFPEDGFLAHQATQFREAAETALADRGLLAVAQGFPPPAAKCIIDIDLAELPELPQTHRDYHRRHETRIKAAKDNRANEEKRFTLTMEAWSDRDLHPSQGLARSPRLPFSVVSCVTPAT